MVRIKRGKLAHKRRKHLLEHAKGFRWGRKNKYRLAKDALRHAWSFSYRDRKVRKREKRQLWQTHINAACKKQNISYSRFTGALKKKHIELDRKVLSELANKHPEIFEKIVKEAIQQAVINN